MAFLGRFPFSRFQCDASADDLVALIDALAAAGCVAVTPDEYRQVSLTSRGLRVARREEPEFRMAWPDAAEHTSRKSAPARSRAARQAAPAAPEVTGSGPVRDAALLARLRTWRNATAQAAGIPAYCVVQNRALEELATHRPTTRGELVLIRGLGPATVAKYGEGILGILHPHATETPVAPEKRNVPSGRPGAVSP